jgi:hypothetical protein
MECRYIGKLATYSGGLAPYDRQKKKTYKKKLTTHSGGLAPYDLDHSVEKWRERYGHRKTHLFRV